MDTTSLHRAGAGRLLGAAADLRDVAVSLRRVPGALRQGACTAVPTRWAEGRAGFSERAPVLLVHGYLGTDAVWAPVLDSLDAAGYTRVVSLRYNAYASEPAEIAAGLVLHAARAMRGANASGVHLVGHSLGGLIVRAALTDPVLARHTRSLVTLATPHQGSTFARVAVGACARHMRPGAAFLDTLAAVPEGDTTWLGVASRSDVVVPPAAAALPAHPGVRNLVVDGPGHLGVTRHAGVRSALVGALTAADARAARTRLAA